MRTHGLGALRGRIYWPSFRRIVAGVILIGLIVDGPSAWGFLTREGRLNPALLGTSSPVNVKVSMDFMPEEFNRERLSREGIYAGMEGKTITLYRVTPASLENLAGIYWIKSIEPID